MLTCLVHVSLVACLTSVTQTRRDEGQAGVDDIPLVGRPADLPFSGASGAFEIEARAEPTRLRLEDTITFTIRVRATAPVRHPPHRPDLRQLRSFAENFFIEEPDEGERHLDGQTIEFVYYLKPRRADVNEVPSMAFVYFNPLIRPASKGFQITFTDAVPLRIRAAEEYAALPAVPEEIYQLATGQDLLSRTRLPEPLGFVGQALLVAAPPLLCTGWYVSWRVAYPDAARRARRQRSQAAKRSLKLLRASRRLPRSTRAGHVAEALTAYLRERFQLSAAEPTPAEAAATLRRAGCTPTLADAAARFFAACDAARYGPAVDGEALGGDAVRLILDVEAQTWAAHSS
jgi:hypothetical protein